MRWRRASGHGLRDADKTVRRAVETDDAVSATESIEKAEWRGSPDLPSEAVSRNSDEAPRARKREMAHGYTALDAAPRFRRKDRQSYKSAAQNRKDHQRAHS
jgi:hypothetical protein